MFKHCADLRNRVLAVAVAGALGVSGAALAVAPTAQLGVLTKATTLKRGDVVKSTVPLSQPAHGVMSHAQLQNHLPTQAQAQAVAHYLKSADSPTCRSPPIACW